MSRGEIDWSMVLGPLLGGSHISKQETHDLERACQQFSRRAVRVREQAGANELPFATEPVPWYSQGRLLADAQIRPGAFLHHAAGDYYIQDASSMLALALCDAQPGQWICDLCASPGGKSTGLLEQMNGQGILLANEVIQARINTLELALARSGLANYLICNLEVEQLVELCGDQFDCVLVDAPCTGQSMVAKGKQSMSSFSSRQISHSAARQQRIVRSAASLVRPGGRLVYSTCTFAYAENEQIIAWLSEQLDDWQPIVDPRLSQWASYIPGAYRLWPHRDACAGGFAAAMQRGAAEETRLGVPANFSSDMPGNRKHSKWSPACLPQLAAPWEEKRIGQWFGRYDGTLHRFDAHVPQPWICHATAGVCVAGASTENWLPSYPASVTAGQYLVGTNSCELSDDQACRFMSGESLRDDRFADGWMIATWRNRPLAWTKVVAGTLKNHVPKSLRQTGLKTTQ